MVTNITRGAAINTSNYVAKNDTKKVDTKNTVNSDTEKNQGLPQDLGTDTFVKSTDEDILNSTYKPKKRNLLLKKLKL